MQHVEYYHSLNHILENICGASSYADSGIELVCSIITYVYFIPQQSTVTGRISVSHL